MSQEPEQRARELMEELESYRTNSDGSESVDDLADDLVNQAFKTASAMSTYDGAVRSFLMTNKANDLATKIVKARNEVLKA